eukprot:SAG22_NODE_464_length_10191_cov_14.495541_4_plen_300_part_00
MGSEASTEQGGDSDGSPRFVRSRGRRPQQLQQPAAAGAAGPRPLRLLCLHGMGSNNDITEMQLSNLKLNARGPHGVECDFFRGTLGCAAGWGLEPFTELPFHSWFDFPGATGLLTGGAGKFNETLALALADVAACIAQHGPYDGLYGFSQGALLVSVLAAPVGWRDTLGLDRCPVRFVICACAGGTDALDALRLPVAAGAAKLSAGSAGSAGGSEDAEAGAASTAPATAGLVAPIEIPSLHLIGKTDWHRGSSEALAAKFSEPTVFEIGCGHEVPMQLARDAATQAVLAKFTAKQRAAQ